MHMYICMRLGISIGHNLFFYSSLFSIQDTIPCRQSGTSVNHGECLSDNKGYGKALGRGHGEAVDTLDMFSGNYSLVHQD